MSVHISTFLGSQNGALKRLMRKFRAFLFQRIKVKKKNVLFWDVAPCRSCEIKRRFGGTYRLHLQGRKIREQGTSVSR
jgi:hypothetical protein